MGYMRKVDNRMAFFNYKDRDDRYRYSDIQFSRPFAPHQCSDDDRLSLLPDDGQQVRGVEWYMGHYIMWKDKSMYSVDPETYARVPRDMSIGLVAPDSLAAIPDVGYGWLSHEGIVFGDHTARDKLTGLQIWPDLKDYSPTVLSKAVGFYFEDYYYLFVGATNEKGYACYMPSKRWYYLSGWNVQCVSLWHGKSDSKEIYAGTNDGFIRRLFYSDLDDSSDITTAIRIPDLDAGYPELDKYIRWILPIAKNLTN